MSVVVTGVGAVSAAGPGFDALRAALSRGGLPLTEVDRSAGHHREAGARTAALVPAEACSEIAPMKARRMSGPSRFALAASRLALRDAGLDPDALASAGDARLGVSLGAAFGGTTASWKILQQCVDPGPAGISPMIFPESVPNAHAGQVALGLGARGPNAAVAQGEASAELSLVLAAEYLRSGRADRMLAGGVNEASAILHAVLDRTGALARAQGGASEHARPFDRRRDGMLLGEGATVLVLEREDSARERGVRVWARLAGWARAFDVTAPPGDWGHGAAALARRLASGLERWGIPVDGLDGVVSGACGSRRGDALEASVLREVFGVALPTVCAPKRGSGEYAGAQLAATVHVLAGGELGAVPDFEPDPGLELTPASALMSGAKRVLASSLGSSGPAAWLFWERPA